MTPAAFSVAEGNRGQKLTLLPEPPIWHIQCMSKRLQVLIPDREMAEIQRLARSERITVGEWVRRTLREARMRRAATGSEMKLNAVQRAAGFSFPTGDVEKVLAEIDRGYRS
jgi:hypothetical protein